MFTFGSAVFSLEASHREMPSVNGALQQTAAASKHIVIVCAVATEHLVWKIPVAVHVPLLMIQWSQDGLMVCSFCVMLIFLVSSDTNQTCRPINYAVGLTHRLVFKYNLFAQLPASTSEHLMSISVNTIRFVLMTSFLLVLIAVQILRTQQPLLCGSRDVFYFYWWGVLCKSWPPWF